MNKILNDAEWRQARLELLEEEKAFQPLAESRC